MIAYLPKIYPDELVYSFLSRLAVHNGYMTYRQAAEDIFGNKLVNPSIEFINELCSEVKEFICKDLSLEDVIHKHTMFPYYARFQSQEKQKQILTALRNGKSINNLFRLLPQAEDRVLRYCPQCAKNDRSSFGETYWHRQHQMIGIKCCPIHQTMLLTSNVLMSGKASPNFYSAEEYAKETVSDVCSVSDVELQLAEYNMQIMNQPIKKGNAIACIKDKLNQTKYISKRGGIVKTSLLCTDLVEYYKDISSDGMGIKESWQIQKILAGQRSNPYDICQLAMFLKISPLDLSERRTATGTSSTNYTMDFDKKVTELLKDGVAINEIARQLSVSSKTVRDIRDGMLTVDKKSVRGKGGRKRNDWESVDEATLPVVRSVLQEMKEKEGERPVRITSYSIARKMNLPEKYFMNLPLCRAEIKRYEVSFEEYWAKEVEWAILYIQKENLPLKWKHLRSLTNLNRVNFQRSLPFIRKKEVAVSCKDL